MFGLVPYSRRSKSIINTPNDFFNFDSFNSFVDSFFNADLFPTALNNSQIKVDIKDKDSEYILEAELPGVNKENLNVEIKDDMLTISVEKNEQFEEEKENYIRKERRFGSLSRSFYVDNIKAEDIKANFDNGILSISLPKKEAKANSSRKIDIN